MSDSLRLKSECFAETYLMGFLGYSKADHRTGITKVFSALSKNSTSSMIGIIDSDKNLVTIPVFQNYNEISPTSLSNLKSASANNLKFYKHHSANKYLIVQAPDFETWIIEIAKANKLLKQNGNIKTVNDLKKITKQKALRIGRNVEFNDLLKSIDSLPNSPFATLRGFIEKIL